MTRSPRLLSALFLVLLAACAARVADTKEVAPPPVEGARQEPVTAASPLSGEGETPGPLVGAAPTLGRAGAEAPRGGLPGPAGAALVIDWDRVRRHAGVDADRGVNVKRHDDTGGWKPEASASPAPSPVASPAEGAGTPRLPETP